MQKSFVAAAAQPLILSILAKEKSYGYRIAKTLNAMLSGEMEWPEATLYPILKRMERVKLIQSEWMVTDNGRPRKYYHITEKGLEMLKEENRKWLRVSSVLKRLCEEVGSDHNPIVAEES